MLRPAFLIAVLWVTGPGMGAQQRFVASTSLLTLDVSVLDPNGDPVTDLSADDFVVTLDKERRPVRTMVFLASQRTNSTEAVRAPSKGLPTGEPDPKLLVILVDDVSLYPTDSKGLFVAAERFVDTIPPGDWVGLASTSGRLAVSSSLDRAPLLASLKRASGWMTDPRRDSEPFVGLMDALEVDGGAQASLRNLIETACGLPANIVASRNLAQLLIEFPCAGDVERKARNNAVFARINTRHQLDAYAAVIKAMASAPGVKQLVILTGGVPVNPADSRAFVPVATAAASAGVQITMLMEEPDQGDISVPRGWARDQRRMLQQTETLAEMSGGQLYRVVGQADRFYQRVLTSASAIYRIGIDMPKTVPSDGNYQVSVTVKQPGVRVLASRYAIPPPPAVATPEEEVTRARTAEIVPAEGERAAPRDPDTSRLLAKAAAYLESYEKAFAVVVAEEAYSQELHSEPPISNRPRDLAQEPPRDRVRTLRSDVLQASIGQREWVAFRDIYEVDGQPVRDRDQRLQKLFIDPPAQAFEQARRIVADSARFNLGALRRDFNVPTMALTYLRPSNQPRSVFTIAGRKDLDGVPAVILEFKERDRPTIIRSADTDLPATGRVWIEAETGRVLKSELSVSDGRAKGKITVTYGAVPKLTVWAPVLMTEEYTGVETIFTRATYSNFRQFMVAVGQVNK
jgi:VWFA-related protein